MEIAGPQQPKAPPTKGAGKLFVLQTSEDAMRAFIPAKSPISKQVAQLSYEQFKKYIKGLGFAAIPTQEAYEKLKKVASTGGSFPKEFDLLVGSPSFNGTLPMLKWLNPPSLPRDLVRPKTPFGKLFPSVPPKPAQNVLGQPVGEAPPPLKMTEIKLHPDIKLLDDNLLACDKGGQVSYTKDELIFSDVYKLSDIRPSVYHKIEFPCSVHISGDFDGLVNWKVHGNLTVAGHWGVSNIEVLGNVIVEGGFQTNRSNSTQSAIIHGDLHAHFIQVSRIKIGGTLQVENSLVTSTLEVGKNIECTGNPGVILGCEIAIKGSISANRVGSERGTPTSIKFETEEASKGSKIGLMSADTRLQIGRTHIIKKMDSAWPEST